MIVSFNWLQDYLKCDLTPEQLAVILTDIGLEVDKFERTEAIPGGLAGVVAGEVLTCGKHPDADRLSVTTVDVGAGESLQIVCGAPNVRAGQKVLVATPGTTLYPTGQTEGLKIKRSKIRGVESCGMICAEDEIGIGTEHEGIMVFDAAVKPGTPATEVLGIKGDYIYEIGLTPNRIDAASHWGVARDVAAWLRSRDENHTLALPSVEGFKVRNTSRPIEVVVQDADGAPRYAGVTVTGLRVAPSPEWMQTYLREIGINPKNNVVDITNFVLHELGQPLHAFDADKIKGGKIVVRTCPEGTKFTTLDDVERTLAADDLMICDAEGPMCIAGVFGGLDSGVTENTKAVFIESAYFNPRRVRVTARRHGLNTDSSFRFERGIDPDMSIYALKRAALLMEELAGGQVSSDVVDIYPEKVEAFRFSLSLGRMKRLIGKEMPVETVRKILGALDVKIEKEEGDVIYVAVPPFRVDVRREADLVEDILRIYGFNNVEISSHLNSAVSYAPKPDRDRLTGMVADMLTANGFTEIMSNSLTKSAYYEGLKSYPAENCVKILNPLSGDLGVMRQTLLFNALEAVQLNINHRNPDLKLYEFGNVYRYDPARAEEGGLAPYGEVGKLAVTVTGEQREASWNVKAAPADFYFLRRWAEKILRRFGMDIYALKNEKFDSELFSAGLSVKAGNKELLQMGVVSPALLGRFDIKQQVYFMEMNFDLLIRNTKKHAVRFEDLPRYPEVRRDLALLLDKGVEFEQLRGAAFQAGGKLLKEVSLFDVYEGDKLPAGKKSYALSFILEDRTQTLTDQVIDRVMKNLLERFAKDFGAAIR